MLRHRRESSVRVHEAGDQYECRVLGQKGVRKTAVRCLLTERSVGVDTVVELVHVDRTVMGEQTVARAQRLPGPAVGGAGSDLTSS